MKIYVVRHAFAGQSGDSRWPNDDLRPLTKEGAKRFANVVKQLVKIGFAPTQIATSPLVRCRQTAEILAKHLPDLPSITELSALAPHSDLAELLQWTEAQQGANVAWVGHAPDVSQLTAGLIGDGRAEIRFAKGACAEVAMDSPLVPGSGTLRWLVTAKLLGC